MPKPEAKSIPSPDLNFAAADDELAHLDEAELLGGEGCCFLVFLGNFSPFHGTDREMRD
eukprot:SAG31_NODE_301_length_18103_cov_13.772551_1_plen_59_part_00